MDYVKFWADNGVNSYANEIRECEDAIIEMKSDAGQYWSQCEFTMSSINKARATIELVKAQARDRYEDLASDY